MLAAVVGILASIAMPLLPVTQTVASISWPQYESGTSVSAPLVSYAPVDLEATIPCRSVQDLSSSGGTVFSTLPAGAPDRERYGLIARVRPGEDGPAMFEMISRNTMLVSAPVDELSGDCAVAVSSTPDRTIATASSSTRAAGQRSSDRDLRPQLVGIFTDLPGPALDGVSVTATVDTRFATSPTVLKVAAMAVAVLATRLALWTLHRLDRADGRRHRRVLPATWWSFTRIDAAVVGTLLLWHVIGANTADDGYATVGYRSDRIRAFLNPDADPQGINYQATQARYALANGGLFGQGLGQSNSKWSYLPQAYNDFIFAIIGEELGAVGALLVIGLFAAVLWVGLRVALRSTDPFLRMLSAVATMWIVLQAFINIAYVVGLLPVTGLQLPLISAGGTSMLTTLLMFGLIAHAAYREPEARVSLDSSTSPRLVTRIFGRPRVGAAPRPVRAPKIRRPARPDPTARGTHSAESRTARQARGRAEPRTTDTTGRPAGRRRTPKPTSR
ncbi:FtsW/RodA/SpoVE family cell cycle protein [Rhodococcus ruber]